MSQNKYLFILFMALVAVLALETFTDADVLLQNLFYQPETHDWLINSATHKRLTVFFYDGLKRFLLICAVICLLNLLLSIKYQNLRNQNRFCLIMLLSFILVPVIIAGAKSFTNVYCPYQLNIYNGFYPFVRVLESYPADFIQPKIGRCFPAGHATAGFAFLGLFYAFQKLSYRLVGLSTGLILGWIAGIYQMLRGQHFFSHTLFSMIAALILIALINRLVAKIQNKHPRWFNFA